MVPLWVCAARLPAGCRAGVLGSGYYRNLGGIGQTPSVAEVLNTADPIIRQ